MRNMSFALTTKQVRKKTKTVTRRFGWWFLKAGDIVQPIEKGMGLRKGEKIKKIGRPIRIISSRAEHLGTVNHSECVKEGFPTLTPMQFTQMLKTHYGKRITAHTICNRIEFEYVEDGKP